jgi:hypothetical protein
MNFGTKFRLGLQQKQKSRPEGQDHLKSAAAKDTAEVSCSAKEQ